VDECEDHDPEVRRVQEQHRAAEEQGAFVEKDDVGERPREVVGDAAPTTPPPMITTSTSSAFLGRTGGCGEGRQRRNG
jgi:hypothetical protein